jgi:hypothetical protein
MGNNSELIRIGCPKNSEDLIFNLYLPFHLFSHSIKNNNLVSIQKYKSTTLSIEFGILFLL